MEKRLVVVGFAKLNTNDPDLRVRFHINEFNGIFDLATNANHERLGESTKLLLSRSRTCRAVGRWLGDVSVGQLRTLRPEQ